MALFWNFSGMDALLRACLSKKRERFPNKHLHVIAAFAPKREVRRFAANRKCAQMPGGRAIRICVDAREFMGSRKTGIGRHAENLLRPLLNEPGLDWVFCAHDNGLLPASIRDSAARCVRLPAAPTPFVDQVALPRIAARERADVLFSPYYKTPLFGPFRKIVTVHDIMFLKLPEFSAWRRAVSALQLRLAVARADLILVDSVFTRQELCAFLPAIARKTETLYPCLDPGWGGGAGEGDAETVRGRFAQGRPFLLYAGNFKPHKNVRLLVEVFLDMTRDGETANRMLLLAGGDPRHMPEIEARVADGGGGNDVRLLRDIGDDTLQALYRAADWTVTLSAYEGFGYPVVEAMACGCPVLCHPNTSLKEIAAGCALSVPRLDPPGVREGLRAALALAPNERAALIARGRENAIRFLDGSTPRAFLAHLERLTGT